MTAGRQPKTEREAETRCFFSKQRAGAREGGMPPGRGMELEGVVERGRGLRCRREGHRGGLARRGSSSRSVEADAAETERLGFRGEAAGGPPTLIRPHRGICDVERRVHAKFELEPSSDEVGVKNPDLQPFGKKIRSRSFSRELEALVTRVNDVG